MADFEGQIFFFFLSKNSQTWHVMKTVVSVVGEIKMRGDPFSLFSSKTMTHCRVCVAGSREGAPQRADSPLWSTSFLAVNKSWTSIPLLDKFDYKTSEEPQTPTVPITSQSRVDS